jgi:hypothetical protein
MGREGRVWTEGMEQGCVPNRARTAGRNRDSLLIGVRSWNPGMIFSCFLMESHDALPNRTEMPKKFPLAHQTFT